MKNTITITVEKTDSLIDLPAIKPNREGQMLTIENKDEEKSINSHFIVIFPGCTFQTKAVVVRRIFFVEILGWQMYENMTLPFADKIKRLKSRKIIWKFRNEKI